MSEPAHGEGMKHNIEIAKSLSLQQLSEGTPSLLTNRKWMQATSTMSPLLSRVASQVLQL
jgi:hypothetical protein